MNRNVPLRRVVPLRQGAPLQARTPLAVRVPLARNVPVRRVSARRARQNRERAAMADRRWPDRREGAVLCAVWEAMQPDWCDQYAQDLHEQLSRARGGSIVEPENCAPLCRRCHSIITDDEPQWAYDLNLLVHSWDAPGGAA